MDDTPQVKRYLKDDLQIWRDFRTTVESGTFLKADEAQMDSYTGELGFEVSRQGLQEELLAAIGEKLAYLEAEDRRCRAESA